MNKAHAKGFHVIGIIVFIVVIGLIGLIGVKVVSKIHDSKKFGAAAGNGTSQSQGQGQSQLSGLQKGCQGNGTVQLTHEPMDMSDVSTILPIGTLAGAHVTPIDHLYFYPKDMTHRDAAPVYAMADGYIVSYSERSTRVDNGSAQQGEYQLYFQHSCSFYSYFDLLTSLTPSLKAEIDKSGGKDLHIPVKSGQEIGRVGAQSLDTAVYNFNITLKGFVNPDSYKTELYKLHTDDFFKYFKDPAKSEMLAKNPRKFAPYGGKIDYDIDGKLIGNWFVEGSHGYEGGGQQVGTSDGKGYWTTHLAIVPDAITQGLIDLSFGDYEGKPVQFNAAASSPDPATISQASGLTKYQFVSFANSGPSETGGVPVPQTAIQGTALFQLTGTRTLKMEVFPGKTADQVAGFTSAAKTYVR